MATTSVIDEHHQVTAFVAGEHARDALAKPCLLADQQRLSMVQTGRGGNDVALQPGNLVAEHLAYIPGTVLADHDVLAKNRDAAPRLMVAVVGNTAVAALALHQQRGGGVGAHELGVPAVCHAGNTLAGGSGLVLLTQLLDVALVQVGLVGRLRASCGKGQQNGGRKQLAGAGTIHWHYP